MFSFIRNIAYNVLWLCKKKRYGQADILMYHSIGDNSALFTVNTKDFLRQMQYLRRFKVVKLSELIDKIKAKKDISGYVSITFDDGFLDNYDNAFHVLKKYNLPASIFLATQYIGGYFRNSQGIELPILDADKIKTMHDSGLIEFLPHTHGHVDLISVDEDVALRDAERSVIEIQNITGVCKRIMAYPKGRYNDKVMQIFKNNDWLGAVSVEDGDCSFGSNIYKLPRRYMHSTMSWAEFKFKLPKI